MAGLGSDLNVMCVCVHVLLLFTGLTCLQDHQRRGEERRGEKTPIYAMQERNGGRKAHICMGCSCWPFAIITLIKVEPHGMGARCMHAVCGSLASSVPFFSHYI